MKDFEMLAKKLGVIFENIELLEQALVHRSYLNEHPHFHLDHNERLEFLGDAVLELVVTEYLYNNYLEPEGILTNWRASLVNSKMLAEMACEFSIEEFLFLSKGESKDAKSKARDYILANAFEAIVGALYLDQGYDGCSEFLRRVLIPKLGYIIEHELYRDPKSKFQELAQANFSLTPLYSILEETGPDHAKYFKVGVYLGDELVGVGHGFSKQEAQEQAAKDALDKKGWK